MRIYELMFITDPRLPEEQREEGVERVKQLIEERVNGKVEKVDRWGIRKLAYILPKSKLDEGDYTVILFRADGADLEPLENLFHVFVGLKKIKPDRVDVLRYLIDLTHPHHGPEDGAELLPGYPHGGENGDAGSFFGAETGFPEVNQLLGRFFP